MSGAAPTPIAPPKPVPFVDLGRVHAPIADRLRDALGAVLERGDFILGAAVGRFEARFAAYVGVAHAIGVGSGTAALTIAMRAAGIGPGDEVIVPAHTYIASALGVVHAGATPVFCDVADDTGLIDLDSAAAAVSPRTAAVVPVHLYGQSCDVDALAGFAERYGIAVIEDAAQAHGASWDGRTAGSTGTASAFSFYPSKNLGALGDAGMVCTDDDEIAAIARRLAHLGQHRKGEHLDAGYNERLDTIHAAALEIKLVHLDAWNASRRAAAAAYRAHLADRVPMLPERRGAEDVYHLFPVRLPERDSTAAALTRAGIGTGVHYSPAVHAQPPFSGGAPTGSLPGAEAWAAEELSLPMFAGLTELEVERVSAALLGQVDGAEPGGSSS